MVPFPDRLATDEVALLYRDNDRLITMTVNGLAHIEADEEIRRQVCDMMPEVQHWCPRRRPGRSGPGS
jgi:hypothetical protein